MITGLPAEEKEKKPRKKAQLINTRIRVLEKLEAQLASSSLSQAHREKLRKKCKNIKTLFNSIDKWHKSIFCIQNPYEQKYKNPSIKDTIIEGHIIKSLILSSKPDNECSVNERKKIVQKVIARFSNTTLATTSHRTLIAHVIHNNPCIIDFIVV